MRSSAHFIRRVSAPEHLVCLLRCYWASRDDVGVGKMLACRETPRNLLRFVCQLTGKALVSLKSTVVIAEYAASRRWLVSRRPHCSSSSPSHFDASYEIFQLNESLNVPSQTGHSTSTSPSSSVQYPMSSGESTSSLAPHKGHLTSQNLPLLFFICHPSRLHYTGRESEILPLPFARRTRLDLWQFCKSH